MKTIFLSVLTIALICFGGCIKDDYSKISNSNTLSPNYSFPVGTQTASIPKPTTLLPIDTVVVLDTLAFSFNSLFTNRQYVKSVMFRIQASNSYPMKASVYVNYYDISGNLLGSFTKTEPLLLAKPNVNSTLGTTTKTITSRDINLSSNEINTLEFADKIITTTVLTDAELSDPILTNWGNFKVYISVGVQAQVEKEI